MSQQPGQHSDDGWHPLWKWAGIGCAIIVLISAAALTFGAWKFANCCGDLIDLGQRTAQARQVTENFSKHIQDENYDLAWRLTSTDYRADRTQKSFRRTFTAYRDIIGSPSHPIVRSISPGQSPADQKVTSWTATVFFARPSSTEALEAIVQIKQFGSGKEKTFRIDGIQLKEVRRVLSDEPPARRVLGFKRRLDTESTDLLYRTMTETYRQNHDKKKFKQQLQAIRDLDKPGRSFVFQSILYEDPEVAIVRQSVGKTRKVIEWELRGGWGGDWQIHSFEVIEGD
jgi:hypothetical protein